MSYAETEREITDATIDATEPLLGWGLNDKDWDTENERIHKQIRRQMNDYSSDKGLRDMIKYMLNGDDRIGVEGDKDYFDNSFCFRSTLNK